MVQQIELLKAIKNTTTHNYMEHSPFLKSWQLLN